MYSKLLEQLLQVIAINDRSDDYYEKYYNVMLRIEYARRTKKITISEYDYLIGLS